MNDFRILEIIREFEKQGMVYGIMDSTHEWIFYVLKVKSLIYKKNRADSSLSNIVFPLKIS